MNIDKLAKQYYRRTKERREIVKQNSYLDWLYDYVCKNKSIDNESILYSENKEDVKNGILLIDFEEYIKKLCFEQAVIMGWHSNCFFDNTHMYFKIQNKFFECFTMRGHLDSWIHINLVEEEPKDNYLIL